jgi:hypothetical protein
MRRILLASAVMLALAGCGDAGRSRSVSDADQEKAADGFASAPMTADMPPPAPPPPPVDMMAGNSASGGAPNQAQVNPNGQQQGQAAQLIAYVYDYTFGVPAARMEELLNAQKAACQQAGPSKCYILTSTISGIGEERASGRMQMKASADWIASFQSGLPASLEGFGARIDSSTTQAEDLTTQIVDISARLNSNKTLRDRLQALLRDRPGRLSDLLEIERELARVQGEIDSTESVLAALRLRVAMSTLTLNYTAEFGAVSESVWRPLGSAFGDFVPSFVESLAGIVSFIASTLIWILLIGGVVLFFWKPWRRRRQPAAFTPERPPATRSGGP